MALESLSIRAEGVQKRFTQRPIFKPVSFEARPGEIVSITGPNGAGKSTLVKIVANVLTPSKGSCEWRDGTKKLDAEGIRRSVGFVAPYLELYDELTAIEQVQFVAEMKGERMNEEAALEIVERFGLSTSIAASDRRLRAYSSGMKQRVRCAMAFANAPAVLLLDEATSNLDDAGTERVLREAEHAAHNGSIVFIATNDARERAIAHREIRIEAL